MADPVEHSIVVPQQPGAPPEGGLGLPPPPRLGEERRSYRGRFGAGYVALLLVLAAVGAGAWAILDRPAKHATSDSWSVWHPEFSGLLGATEIARHVRAEYRQPSGREALTILAGRPQVGGSDLVGYFVQPQTARFDRDVAGFRTGNAIQYMMCGFGTDCLPAEGRATPERARWFRRQAIELALYTFHYDKAVQNVIVYLPPPSAPLDLQSLRQQLEALASSSSRAAQPALLLSLVAQVQEILLQQLQAAQQRTPEPRYVMVFRRKDLEAPLAQPLAATLVQQEHYLVTDAMSDLEVREIDKLSSPSHFAYGLEQLQDGSYILVLTPADPTG